MDGIESLWSKAIGKDWYDLLVPELLDNSTPLLALLTSLALENSTGNLLTYAPQYSNIFRVFNLLQPKDVKVVCMGQDPYHSVIKGRLVADGLAFSCSTGNIPPSLANIFKEVYNDGYPNYPRTGNLEPWVKEGVFLLNRVLTVQLGKPNSHARKGWEWFTSLVIQKLSTEYNNKVFLLWGEKALKVRADIKNKDNHLILTAGHPSPYSYDNGFKNCGHFAATNRYLEANNIKPIIWG
jgi:uracil-DNA glycosylase